MSVLSSISEAVIYIVRISQRKNATAARDDYNFLKKDNARGKNAMWDKDTRNNIAIGNWIGFIVGENGNEVVELYQVIGEAPISKCPKHWKRVKIYTDQDTATKPITRELIVLSSDDPVQLEWNYWKRAVDYKEKYTPRGTTKARNPFGHDRIMPNHMLSLEGAVNEDDLEVVQQEEAVSSEQEPLLPTSLDTLWQLIHDLANEIHILSTLSGYGTLPEIQRRLSLLHKTINIYS